MRTAAGGQCWPSTARPEDGLSPRLAGRWTRPKPRTRASTPREGDVRSGGGSRHHDLGPAPAGRLEARVVEHVGVADLAPLAVQILARTTTCRPPPPA